jgi:hypothetical protein
MFKRLLFLLSAALFVGCTNATPEVSFLNQPSIPVPVIPKVQSADFASADLAAAQKAKDTATENLGYSAKILIQSGAPAKAVHSADGYTLENRQLSF